MALEFMNDISQNIQHYKQLAQNQIKSALISLQTNIIYYKDRIKGFGQWAISQYEPLKRNVATFISWIATNTAYFITHLPQFSGQFFKGLLNKSLHFLNQLWRAFNQSLKIGRRIAAFVLRNGWRLIRFLGRSLFNFFRYLPQNLYKMYEFFKELIIFLKDLTILIVKNIFTNIPYYSKKFGQFLINLSIGLKDLTVACAKGLIRFGKHLFTNFFHICKVVIKKLANQLFIMLALTYGLSSLIIEFVMDTLNTGFRKMIGVNLAQYSLFQYIQTALSVTLAGVLLLGIARLSLFAIGGIFALTFLHPNKQDKHIAKTKENPSPKARIDEEPAYLPTLEAQLKPAAQNNNGLGNEEAFVIDFSEGDKNFLNQYGARAEEVLVPTQAAPTPTKQPTINSPSIVITRQF